MKPIIAAVDELMHHIAYSGTPDELRLHPGSGRGILSEGLYRLSSHSAYRMIMGQVGPDVRAELRSRYDAVEKLCESPIERNVLAALLTGHWHASRDPIPSVHNSADKSERMPWTSVVIIPQFQIARYRLDFVVVARKEDAPAQLVNIECDGADYHDRERDNERDGYLATLGMPVYRMTGQGINRDVYGEVDPVILKISDWIAG